MASRQIVFSCELSVSSLFRLCDCSRKVLLFLPPLVIAALQSLPLLSVSCIGFHETPSTFKALPRTTKDFYFEPQSFCL